MSESEFTSTDALLTSLGWPLDALDQKGAMQWGAALGDPPDKVMSASVLVKPAEVLCRVRSAPLDGIPQSHLELTWAISPGNAPIYGGAKRAVGDAPASESEALGWFKDYVNAIGNRPSFQAMGRRDKNLSSPRSSL